MKQSTKLLAVGLASVWIICQISFQVFDFRIFSNDVGYFLKITLDALDLDQTITTGGRLLDQPGVRETSPTMGVLANYIAMLPLLVTRDIQAQYYLLTMLYVASLIVFFLAMRALGHSEESVLMGTAVFAFQPMLWMQVPEHTYMAMPFMALVFFFMVQIQRRRLGAIPLAYWAVGASVSMFIPAFVLVFPVWVLSWWATKQRRGMWALWTAVGAMGFVVISYPLCAIFWSWEWLGGFVRDLMCHAMVAPGTNNGVMSSLLMSAVLVLTLGALWFGFGGALFGYVALARFREIKAAFGRENELLDANRLLVVLSVMVVPVLCALNRGYVHYYIAPAGVGVAYLTGMFFEWNEVSGKRVLDLKMVGGALTICTPIVVMLGFVFGPRWEVTHVHFSALRLGNVIKVTERMAEVIEREELEELVVSETLYNVGSGQLVKAWDGIYASSYWTLGFYLYPELRKRIVQEKGPNVLAVCSWMRTGREELPAFHPKAVLLDRFSVSAMDFVILYVAGIYGGNWEL